MTSLRRTISIVATVFISLIFLFFLSSQIKADSDFDLAISLLESGEANATATFEYIDELVGKGNILVEAIAICKKWYGGVTISFTDAISDVKEKNFQKGIEDVEKASEFTQHCQDIHIQDARLSSSNDYIRDICRSAQKAIDTLITQPPL